MKYDVTKKDRQINRVGSPIRVVVVKNSAND